LLQRLLRRFLLTEPELALSYGPDSQPRAVVEAIAATPNSHSATSGRTRHDVPRSRPTSPLMYCRFPAKHSIDAKTCRRPSPPARALHQRSPTKLEECDALVGIESLVANRINAVAGGDSSGPRGLLKKAFPAAQYRRSVDLGSSGVSPHRRAGVEGVNRPRW
jgi:hypothetical protein